MNYKLIEDAYRSLPYLLRNCNKSTTSSKPLIISNRPKEYLSHKSNEQTIADWNDEINNSYAGINSSTAVQSIVKNPVSNRLIVKSKQFYETIISIDDELSFENFKKVLSLTNRNIKENNFKEFVDETIDGTVGEFINENIGETTNENIGGTIDGNSLLEFISENIIEGVVSELSDNTIYRIVGTVELNLSKQYEGIVFVSDNQIVKSTTNLQLKSAYGCTFDGVNINVEKLVNCILINNSLVKPINEESSLIISCCKFISGGVIVNGGKLFVDRCYFTRCHNENGGAIFSYNSSSGSSLNGRGGAIVILYNNEGPSMNDSDESSSVNNTNEGPSMNDSDESSSVNNTNEGPSVNNTNDYSLSTISNCLFYSCESSGVGGAVFLDNYYVKSKISNNIFFGNRAFSNGGAISSQAIDVYEDNIFFGNKSTNGGSIFIENPYAMESISNINNNIFINSHATKTNGGALSVVNCFIENNLFSNCSAKESGGGIDCNGGDVRNCVFRNCKSTFKGGAIVSTNDVYSSIIENCCAEIGGGVYLMNGKFINSIVRNSNSEFGSSVHTSGYIMNSLINESTDNTRAIVVNYRRQFKCTGESEIIVGDIKIKYKDNQIVFEYKDQIFKIK